jgi:type I restriction enzyme R subunit
MVVTSSRKEAVRYKQAFDKYITQQGYKNYAMVAFGRGRIQRQRSEFDF